MAQDQIQKLMQGAIKAAQLGQKDLARRAFKQVLKLDPQHEGAWLGVATVAANTKERLIALKRLLQINPQNENALEALKRLGIPPEKLLGTAPPSPQSQPEPVAEIEPEPEPEPYVEPEPEPDDQSYDEYLSDFDALFEEDEPEPVSPFVEDDTPPPEPDDDYLDTFDTLFGDQDEPDPTPPLPEVAEPQPEDDDYLDTFDELFDEDDDEPQPITAGEDFSEFEDTADDDFDIFEEEPSAPAIDAFEDELEADFASIDDDEPEDIAPSRPVTGTLAATGSHIDVPDELPVIPQPLPAPDGDLSPLPDTALLNEITQVGDELAQSYLSSVLGSYDPGFEWKRKNRNRAGEREIMVFRAQIAAAVVAVLAIVGVIAGLVILNVPSVRVAMLEPTATLTPTPTLTPTNTPGVTPTFSPEPELTYTPSPTLNPSVTPGSIIDPPDPTDVYVPVGAAGDNDIERAVALINNGDYDEAETLLREVREATFNTGDPRAAYYLSVLSLLNDAPGGALESMNDAQAIWESSPNFNRGTYDALLNAGFARVHLYQARELLAEERNQPANNQLNEAQTRARAAIALDPSLVDGHILLSEYFLLRDQLQEAVQVLDAALLNENVSDIFTNIELRAQKARLFLLQERYDDALQEANEGLTIQPYAEELHQIRIQAALAKQDAGLAVIYSEQYLFFYPGSVTGFKLLGDARVLEGKIDLALQSYEQALQGDPDDPVFADTLLARARVYADQGRDESALQDLNAYVERREDDLPARVLRMNVAYRSSDYDTAETDAERLLGTEIIPDNEIYVMLARVAVDQAEDGDTNAYQEALTTLNQGFNNRLAEALRPIANEYLARIQYNLGDFDAALNAVEQAIATAPSGSRYYLRGLILQAQGDLEEDPAAKIPFLQDARRDYEWVLSWSRIFPYAFRDDAQERYDLLLGELDILRAQVEAQ